MSDLLPAVGRTALADHVRDAIYENLLTLAIPPGGRINIDAIARHMNVSPTPTREALAGLEAEELVIRRPMSGYVAAPLMSKAALADLLDLRLHVEPWLAGLAAHAEAEARATLHDLVRAPDEENAAVPQAIRSTRIHDQIAVLAGNGSAQRMLQRLNAPFHIHRYLATHAPGDTARDDHSALVRPIVAGRAGDARRLMTSHLTAIRDRIVVVPD